MATIRQRSNAKIQQLLWYRDAIAQGFLEGTMGSIINVINVRGESVHEIADCLVKAPGSGPGGQRI